MSEAAETREAFPAPRYRPTWRAALVLVAFALAWVAFAESESAFYFLRDDNATYHLPNYVHNLRTLEEEGELAFFNPHQYLGTPHLATGQACVLYPPVYVATALAQRLGDVRWTLELLVVFHTWLSGLGMLFLLGHLGLGRRASYAGMLLWVTAPFVVFVGRSWIPLLYSASYSVWSLYFVVRVVERPGIGRVLALAACKTIFFWVGYPQGFLISSLCEGVWVLGALATSPPTRQLWRRQVVAFGAAATLAAAWSAPLLLPMASLVSMSDRAETRSIESFLQFSVDPGALAAAQWGGFGGQEQFDASYALFYVSLPLLLCIPAALVLCRAGYRSPNHVGLFVAMTGLALLASTEAWGAAHFLPFVSMFRWPFKHFLFVWLYLIPVGAFVFRWLLSRRPRVAWGLFAITLAVHPFLLYQQGDDTSFGPAILEQPVASYRGHPLLRQLSPDARVVAFRGVGAEKTLLSSLAPSLLAFNFATLLGEHQLSGYEPLVAETSRALALGSRFGVLDADKGTSAETFRQLGLWAVRDVLAPARPGVRRSLLASGALQPVSSFGGIDLYRNRFARPFVEIWTAADNGTQIQNLRLRASSVDFHFASEVPASLRVAMPPSDRWSLFVDGHRTSDRLKALPEGGLLLQVEAGRHAVSLRYVEPLFSTGLSLASLGFVIALGAWLVSRRT